MRKSTEMLVAFLVFLLTPAVTCTVHGSFIFIVQQIPQGVLITGNGTLNTSTLTYTRTGASTGTYVDGGYGALSSGPVSNISNIPYSQYSGISGPASFGTGGPVEAESGAGDTVGIALGSNLVVPANYASGSLLSDSAIFDFCTIASLGLTPGIYVYTWGSGPTADSLTVNIGVVPEPASIALAGAAACVALLRRRLPAAPRTDPCERNYRTGLLPWIMTASRRSG